MEKAKDKIFSKVTGTVTGLDASKDESKVVNNDAGKVMNKASPDSDKLLSALLKAVSDTTRRSLLTELCQQGPCRVTDLANYYDMSLNAVSKHIKVLEKAGLISRKTVGRVHWIEANIAQVNMVEDWFKQIKSIWALRLDRLDEILTTGDKKDD